MVTYKFVDLFCGGGGMSLGLKKSGFEHILAADYWDVAKQNYTSYDGLSEGKFQQVDLLKQDEQVKLIDQLKDLSIDVLAGGPPCQGFSTLGKRSRDDHRNTLVDTYLRIASEIKPKIIIMENVPAIRSMKHKSGIKYPEFAKNFLRENGYYAETLLLEGKHVSLAQTRKRIFLIGMKKSEFKDTLNFSSILSETMEKLVIGGEYKTLKNTIYDLPRFENGEGEDEIVYNGKTIYNHNVFKYQDVNLERIKQVPYGGGLQDIPDRFLSKHLMKMKTGGYGSGGFVKNLYGRLSWEKPSGTIVAGIKKITCGRFFHPENNRLLTVREAARLQSFPEDYKFLGSFIDQYTIVGNAVPPKFATLIGNILNEINDTYLKV